MDGPDRQYEGRVGRFLLLMIENRSTDTGRSGLD